MPLKSHLAGEKLTFLDHLMLGRLYRMPWCCVLRWCIGTSCGEKHQGTKRGGLHNAHGVFVPCGIFHKSAS